MAVALVRSDILYAWKGPSLLIVSMRGECNSEHPLSGFYFREARFLRTMEPLPWRSASTRPILGS
jgi:hypothetical protein